MSYIYWKASKIQKDEGVLLRYCVTSTPRKGNGRVKNLIHTSSVLRRQFNPTFKGQSNQ